MTRVNNGLDHWTLGLYFELFLGPFPWTFFFGSIFGPFYGVGGGGGGRPVVLGAGKDRKFHDLCRLIRSMT